MAQKYALSILINRNDNEYGDTLHEKYVSYIKCKWREMISKMGYPITTYLKTKHSSTYTVKVVRKKLLRR